MLVVSGMAMPVMSLAAGQSKAASPQNRQLYTRLYKMYIGGISCPLMLTLWAWMRIDADTTSVKAYMETVVVEAGCMRLRWYAGSTGPTAGKSNCISSSL